MARIEIEGNQLVVHIEGFDRIMALKSRVSVPLAHVRGVDPHPQLPAGFDLKWIRAPGTSIPGVVHAGSYYRIGDGWYFLDVHDIKKCVSIDLVDEHYKRLIVQVDEPPEAVAARVESALRL